MKRDVALQDLSRDHHFVLIQARELRRAAERETTSETPVVREFLSFWDRDVTPHFQEEEEVLDAAIASATARAHYERMVADHAWLRTEVAELRAVSEAGADLRPLMGEIGRLLETHVRFEEAMLFEAIQRENTRHDLDHLHGASYTFRIGHRGPGSCSTRPSHVH